MRKLVCLVSVCLVCIMLISPVFADRYAPSISNKDGPEIEDAVMKEDDEKEHIVKPCLIVTSVLQAMEKTTDISQEGRNLLLDMYRQVEEDTLELPLPDNYVVRELVDVSFQQIPCVEPNHGHEENLKKPGTTVTVTFQMGIPYYVDVVVLVYVDEAWETVVATKNNGDGSVTVTFEDIGPVAFCIEQNEDWNPPETGDEMGTHLVWWIVLLAASLVVMIILLVGYWWVNRKNK